MGPLQQIPLLVLCSLVSLWLLGFLVRHRRKTGENLAITASRLEVNDSLDQLDKPSGIPEMQILFFHGLPFQDFSRPHLSTWDSGNGFIWPQEWLAEHFPGAHIYSVKYAEGMKVGSFKMNNIGENLISDLIQGNIGQVSGCPVVLVGHCIGGLVIKELCLKAHEQLCSSSIAMSERAKKLRAFLVNIRGIFYYSTPHHGIPEIAKARSILRSPLFKYFEILSTEAAVLNSNFNNLCGLYPKWKIQGIGESLPMKSGLFQSVIVVPEASAREGIFNTLLEDHFSICKPQKKTSGGFYFLTQLLHNIVKEDIKLQEEICPQNIQYLPESIVGIESSLEEVKARLENVAKMGVTGMGGLGKTTLAKAIFNDLCSKFEYTCFVSSVKLMSGNVEALKGEVWKHVYWNGKKIVGEIDWSQLTGKRLLLILDDVSSDRDLKLLAEIAHGPSVESRFIATSRNRHLFDDFYEVPLLNESNAQQLFTNFAFRDKGTPPHKLENLAKEIVKKCEGLPLTLEVLGQWLRRTKDEKDWRQTLDALGRAELVTDFNERLWAKLRPSIDGLEEIEKQMFLDATTFFYNDETYGSSYNWCFQWTLEDAQAAWREAYGVNERLLWRTLVERSLVYEVKENESIKVHEQLRSLGRKIASELSDSSKCRVLEISTALKLLQSSNEIDKQNTHALRLVESNRNEVQKLMEEIFELQSVAIEGNLEGISFVDGKIRLSCVALQKLKRLRYLELDDSVVIDGAEESKRLPSSLVVFQCGRFNTLNFAHQRHLVVLKVFGHDLKYLPKSIGQLSALRILLLYNAEIETIPDDIGDLKQLEILHLHGWWKLETLPQTVGQLSKLKILKLVDCDCLRTLPKSFGDLSALEDLVFISVGLEALPTSVGHLAALRSLKIYDSKKLESLPESFGLLSALVKLELLHCSSLKSLPKSFRQLSALSRLEIVGCHSLQSLPESFGKLPVLSHLRLEDCDGLHSLPKSFGQVAKLQYLEINHLSELERLPDSFIDLVTLRHLIIHQCLSLKSIPDYIRNLPSLHTLELGVLPLVKELPSWLGKLSVNYLALSRITFRIQDWCFSVTEKESMRPADVVSLVYRRARRKVAISDYEGALAELEVGHVGLHKLDGFLLQEKGIVKRMMGDLHGALGDLTAALECFSKAGDKDLDTYDCWKHRGYVKFLMGDPKGAESDGTMALKLEIEWRRKYWENVFSGHVGYYGVFKSLGQESIRYMNFTLTGRREMKDHRKLMLSSHDEVMQKVKASDFQGALASFDITDVALLPDDDRAYFFQERGVLKRLMGDLGGALEDLTRGLELEDDDYDRYKHRGYVKFLLGDLDGARIDAGKCLTLKREESEEDEYLGGTPVAFLEFNLK